MGHIPDATQSHGLGAILDWLAGTFFLDLNMCSVFLAQELVSILSHSFTDETLVSLCLLITGLFSHSFQLSLLSSH